MRSTAIAVGTVLFAALASANVPPPTAMSPRPFFVGTWSLDGSCASGFGMTLQRDGKAGYDEYGTGLWAIADNGQRLMLIVEDVSEEADRKTEAELIEFRVVARQGNALTLKRLSDGATLKAKRCV